MKSYQWKFKTKQLRKSDNQYDRKLLDDDEPVEAIYIDSGTESDALNPFIAALPPAKEDDTQLMLKYTKGLSSYTFENVKNMTTHEKVMAVNEMRTKFRICLSFQKQLEDSFHSSLVNSYRLRKLYRDTNAKIPANMDNKDIILHQKMYGDSANSANSSFALLGYSGVGKSTSLNQLLMDYPQLIIHKIPGTEDRIPQIVYLVVNCLPNSNFNELYISIGKAIDRALGNIQPYYEVAIRKTVGLSSKMNKVIELIETFNIGIILFDEIQLIDFKHTKENSFEGLMTIVNATKVAIAVIGTEDAYSKMFINLRNARRVGTLIDASNYTENDSYFKNIVSFMMNYQWFDIWIDCDDEIIDALKECSYGIIDQLISLYVMMHIDYFEKKGKKPKVNGDYVRMISRKYFPYMKQLNKLLRDPMADKNLKQASEETQKHLNELLRKSEEQNKSSQEKQIELNDTMLNIMKIKEQIIQDIEDVGFERPEIENCFNKKIIDKGIENKTVKEIKKEIITELAKPKNQTTKKKKTSKDEMIQAIIQ